MVYLRFTLENVQENRHMKHLDINFQPVSNVSIPVQGKFLQDFSRYETAAKLEEEEVSHLVKQVLNYLAKRSYLRVTRRTATK